MGVLRAKRALACQHALRAHVLTYQRELRVNCSWVNFSCVLTCQRALRAYVITYMPTYIEC